MTIETKKADTARATKMTASELQDAVKASRAKVRLTFTANGNPAWRTVYRYGKNDRQIGSDRLTKKEANERLAEFGLTANLVVEIEKAIEKAQADKTAAMKASGEIYTGGRNCHMLTDDEITAIYAKFATGEVIADNTVKFEVGKTYAAKKTVLFDCQFTMTVIKRTAQFVTFQFGDDEDDIRRRKITCEYGVETIFIHETNAIDGDYEFSAKNVVEAKADDTNEPIEELPTGTIEVTNGAKAFEVVAKYFPNGLKFKDAHRWINGAYEYTFTDGKEMFLHASCDRDNTRIETLQVVNTDESGSKRKPLFVIINPPATVAENPATVETPDIFSNETITVGTPAEAMTLIETVANDNFIFNRQTDKHTIRNEFGEWDYATARTFENVNCTSPEFGTFRFTEIITADGKLDHVEFQKGVNIGSKLVKIFIKPATVET